MSHNAKKIFKVVNKQIDKNGNHEDENTNCEGETSRPRGTYLRGDTLRSTYE